MKAGSSRTVIKDVVLVGGGHSHIHVLKMFGMKPMEGVRLTLITRDVDTPYSGMIPGHVAGIYTKEECHIDLAKLARFANAQLLHVEVNKIDPERKFIFCADGRPPISYDLMSIDIGSSPTLLQHSNSHITPVKPIDGFSARWQRIVSRIVAVPDGEVVNVVVVGGGAGGVELTFAMHHRLRNELAKLGKDPNQVHIGLVTRGSSVLSSHNVRVQGSAMEEFQNKGISLHLSSCVTDCIEENGQKFLCVQNGARIAYDECVWCTHATGQAWIKETGLEVTSEGFICVQDTLESTNWPDVFACGDCCHMVNNPRPKSGVFAVRQGPFIVNNIRHRLLDEPLEAYIPQSQWLGLIGTGDGSAIASRGPIALKGEYLWQLKDFIDRSWLRGFQELPTMAMAAPVASEVAQRSGEQALEMLAHAAMRCGGCGSKVGSSILTRALESIRHLIVQREEVVAGLDAPDDVAFIRPPPPGHLMVQTVDFFKNFVTDPFLFGQIAANHALSDCHAKNADPVSAMAIVVLPYGFEDKMEATLVQVLAGACHVLVAANCALVGGHTAEGEELALGFAITGVVHEDKVLRKAGVQGSYSLILTKALGTGTLMAADMRVQARGVWIEDAFHSMLQSNRAAAQLLGEHGCVACTDVTGFGLIGHLLEMLQASSRKDGTITYGAQLFLNHIPLLPGAVECVERGIFSSLQAQNLRNRRAVASPEEFADNPRYPLLFDPQTAGGLLAAVPTAQSAACIAALQAVGYSSAAVIGVVTQHLSAVEELIQISA